MALIFRVNLPGPFVYAKRIGGKPKPKAPMSTLALIGYMLAGAAIYAWYGVRFAVRWLVALRRANPTGRVLVNAIVVAAVLDLVIWLLPVFEDFG